MAFWDRMQETINQGLKTSREMFGKAKDKAQDLGEMGVLKFEIRQLENQAEKLVARLGTVVYELLVQGQQNSISSGTPNVKEVLAQIDEVKKMIEGKEEELKKFT